MAKRVDVCLVEMPFSSAATPVFSLSILKGCLNRAGISGEVIYGNMLFSCRTGIDDYVRALTTLSQSLLFGEAVFALAAHHRPELMTEYREKLLEVKCDNKNFMPACLALFDRLQPQVEPFIEELGGLILAKKPKIVGFSTCFFQNNACLALAEYIKKHNPEITVMAGGANCVAETAWGMVKCNKNIDYVFSGEADEIFAEVCARIIADGKIPADELPYGLLTREMDLDGKPIPVRQTANLNDIPYPDYDDYFAALKKLDHEKEIYPAVFMEFSRGCWWNMKKPCKFCGLNSAAHEYRIKTTERVLAEIEYLADRYNIKKFTTTDNILSPVHLKELLPILAKKDYIFFAEVKSNLTRLDVQNLKKAGFILLQPGIESLQDDLLQLMNKGNRGIKHIELLRNFANEGIEPVWHFLLGFPEEKDEYYEEMTKIIPLITHLPPPKQVAHIMYIRGSEYVNHAEKYGLKLEPNSFYKYIYSDEEFIRLSAIMYQEQGVFTALSGKVIWIYTEKRKKFADAVDRWKKTAMILAERLTVEDKGDSLEIMDLRQSAVKMLCSLRGVLRDVALATDSVTTREKVVSQLAGKYDELTVLAAIDELIRDRYLLDVRGELLFLPLSVDHPAAVKELSKRPHGYYKRIVFLVGDPSEVAGGGEKK